jgi:hypothetical protein
MTKALGITSVFYLYNFILFFLSLSTMPTHHACIPPPPRTHDASAPPTTPRSNALSSLSSSINSSYSQTSSQAPIVVVVTDSGSGTASIINLDDGSTSDNVGRNPDTIPAM